MVRLGTVEQLTLHYNGCAATIVGLKVVTEQSTQELRSIEVINKLGEELTSAALTDANCQ